MLFCMMKCVNAVFKSYFIYLYLQGMNFIVGYLLIITKDEEKSFWLMDALIGRILPGMFVNQFSCHRSSLYSGLVIRPD